jgi:hypothetical protein
LLLAIIVVPWLCTVYLVLALCRAASGSDERDER